MHESERTAPDSRSRYPHEGNQATIECQMEAYSMWSDPWLEVHVADHADLNRQLTATILEREAAILGAPPGHQVVELRAYPKTPAALRQM